MRLEVEDQKLVIIPETPQDKAYFRDVLGLERDKECVAMYGDYVERQRSGPRLDIFKKYET